MKPFAKAIDVFPWHLRQEKEKSTNTILYVGVNEVNVRSEISNDMEDWDLDFDKELNFDNVHLTYKFKQSIIDEFLRSFPIQEYFYKNLKKDGQFFRTFDKFFIDLHDKLKGKKSDCFENGKIPNNEIEFLKCISDVINHRIEILSEK